MLTIVPFLCCCFAVNVLLVSVVAFIATILTNLLLLLLQLLFLNFVVVVDVVVDVEQFSQLIKTVFVRRISIYVLSTPHNAKLQYNKNAIL